MRRPASPVFEVDGRSLREVLYEEVLPHLRHLKAQHAPADSVNHAPRCLAMPRITTLKKPPHANNHRAANRLCVLNASSAIIQLFRRRSAYLGTEFRRPAANRNGHADSATDDPSSERLVSNTRACPYFSCKPRVAPCTPPFGQRPRRIQPSSVQSELNVECATDGGHHVDPGRLRMSNPGCSGYRCLLAPGACVCNTAIRQRNLAEYVARELRSSGCGRAIARSIAAPTSRRASSARRAHSTQQTHWNQEPVQSTQRIRARSFATTSGACMLRILPECPDRRAQSNATAQARALHGPDQQPCWSTPQLRADRPIAFENGQARKGAQVRSDIPAGV